MWYCKEILKETYLLSHRVQHEFVKQTKVNLSQHWYCDIGITENYVIFKDKKLNFLENICLYPTHCPIPIQHKLKIVHLAF